MNNAQATFTSSEWSRWLAHEEDRLSRVYAISPGHLIVEYRADPNAETAAVLSEKPTLRFKSPLQLPPSLKG